MYEIYSWLNETEKSITYPTMWGVEVSRTDLGMPKEIIGVFSFEYLRDNIHTFIKEDEVSVWKTSEGITIFQKFLTPIVLEIAPIRN